jgi:hypothetical protein
MKAEPMRAVEAAVAAVQVAEPAAVVAVADATPRAFQAQA